MNGSDAGEISPVEFIMNSMTGEDSLLLTYMLRTPLRRDRLQIWARIYPTAPGLC